MFQQLRLVAAVRGPRPASPVCQSVVCLPACPPPALPAPGWLLGCLDSCP